MRRVKKEEVKLEYWVKPDGLDYCLECWAAWMLSDDRDLSASRMKLHGGAADDDEEREGFERNVHEEQRLADHKIGAATNAMIEDLKPAHKWAIYRRCGITTQWKFPLLDFTEVLVIAQENLESRLRKNIVTGTLF
jgi:hypothetical protein